LSRRIFGVEVVEVVLVEGFLGTLPHQVSYPGDEDVAERVGIDGVNLGLDLGVVGFFKDAGLGCCGRGRREPGLGGRSRITGGAS
jgi:hypothetical protein